jgi:hypothetical protein
VHDLGVTPAHVVHVADDEVLVVATDGELVFVDERVLLPEKRPGDHHQAALAADSHLLQLGDLRDARFGP